MALWQRCEGGIVSEHYAACFVFEVIVEGAGYRAIATLRCACGCNTELGRMRSSRAWVTEGEAQADARAFATTLRETLIAQGKNVGTLFDASVPTTLH